MKYFGLTLLLLVFSVTESFAHKDDSLSVENFIDEAIELLISRDTPAFMALMDREKDRIEDLATDDQNVALNILFANYHSNRRELEKEQEYIISAYENRDRLSHSFLIAKAHHDMGVLKFDSGDWQNLEDIYLIAVEYYIKSTGENSVHVAMMYGNLGNFQTASGLYADALKYHAKSREIFEENFGPEHPFIMMYLGNVATIYRHLGDTERAIRYTKRSSQLAMSLFPENHPFHTLAILNLSTFYISISQPDIALEYANQAYEIRKNHFPENHPEMERVYYRFGDIYRVKKDFEQSVHYLQKSIAINSADDQRRNSLIQNYLSLGRSLIEWGRHKDGRNALSEGLDLMENNDRAYFQYGPMYEFWIARSHYNEGSLDLALEFLFKSFETAHYTYEARIGEFPDINGFGNTPNMMDVFNLVGQIYFEKGKESGDVEYFIKAAESLKSGMEIIWLVRLNQTNEASSIMYSDQLGLIYDNSMNVFSELYKQTEDQLWLDEIYAVMQQSKAATMHRAMPFSQSQTSENIPAEILQKEQEFNADRANAEVLLQQARLQNFDSDSIRSYEVKLFEASRKLDEYLESLRNDYPEYLAQRYRPFIYNTSELQHFLQHDELYIEFTLSSDNKTIYTFITDSDQSKIYRTNIDGDIERKIEEYRKVLTSRAIVRRSNRAQFEAQSRNLYDILIEPVAEYFQNKNHLIIVPDASLHFLPFETLLTKDPTASNMSDYNYLIKDYSVRYHYNSSLWMIRERNNVITSTGNLLAYAPVFDDLHNLSVSDQDVSRSPQLSALPYTENEVQEISNIFREAGGEASIFLRTNAIKPLSAQLGDQEIIHFATHGFFDFHEPSFSGLAFYNQQGKPEMLYANEVYTLNLNSRLIVLSGCDSGVGVVNRGEGLISLNRAFMYAGAENIVYSLWQVDDEQTQKLMVHFYKELLTGKTIPLALQNAKLAMLEDPVSALPVYWAPFMLMGQ